MKSSNLARRNEQLDGPVESPLERPSDPGVADTATERARPRPRPRLERRTIEIRDQGLAPFRVH